MSGPVERLAALTTGQLAIGADERILSLLTTGPDGFPRHCALSRNEIDVADDRVHIAIHARRAGADIERTGLATLVVIDGVDILSYRLTVESSLRLDGVLALRFTVAGYEIDSLGIALSPSSFVVSSHLAELDRWEGTRVALDRIRSG